MTDRRRHRSIRGLAGAAAVMALGALLPLPARAGEAWEWRSVEAPGGALDVAVLLPPGLAKGAAAPVLLALPPGAQDRAMVEFGLRHSFAAEAAARGWVVVSPAALAGRPFVEEGFEDLAFVLDWIAGDFSVEGGRPHVAGVSNGGLAAFRLALERPEGIASLVGLPGMPAREEDHARLERLATTPVHLFVGGDDQAWRRGAERTRSRLEALGAPAVGLTVFEGEGHVPPSLEGGAAVFERLEEFRRAARASAAAREAVAAVLDDFHAAAAAADGERYFAHFAPEAVFLGTDATERWTVPEFRAYAAPYFDRGRGWTYVAIERHVSVSPDGTTAWFDERLQNETYGEVRGSGALLLLGDAWRIAQYNLAFPVPNDLAKDLVERIRAAEGEKETEKQDD